MLRKRERRSNGGRKWKFGEGGREADKRREGEEKEGERKEFSNLR